MPLISSIITPGRTRFDDNFPSLLASFLPKDIDRKLVFEYADYQLTRHNDLHGANTGEAPELFNICGLPASGKSYEAKKYLLTNSNYLYLSFDSIMEQIPFYQTECRENRENAFDRWEIPARILGYGLLLQAVNSKWPILFEHGNSIEQHIAMYQIIKFIYGYKIKMRFINSPPEVVIPRLAARERYFSERRVYERWEAMDVLIPAYKVIADEFDEIGGWPG